MTIWWLFWLWSGLLLSGAQVSCFTTDGSQIVNEINNISPGLDEVHDRSRRCRTNDVAILASSSSTVKSSDRNIKNTDTLDSRNSVFSMVDSHNRTVLTYYGLMLSGAVARSAAATAVHPLNVIKTMLQTKEGKIPEFKWKILSRGAGSQFIMSIPHGAINFAVTETTKIELAKLVNNSTLSQNIPHRVLNPLLDFISSALSTFICSIVSTPQMVLTDRIMGGVYPNFLVALQQIALTEGIKGFYKGWLPAVVQKIPSYALTWMFFQQLKLLFLTLYGRTGTTIENTIIGSFAAAGACCVMIPVDTIKTRIVMQRPGDEQYLNMYDCLTKILSNEGPWALYRALPPRLLAVVPMIGIQFGVYEFMKRVLLKQPAPDTHNKGRRQRIK